MRALWPRLGLFASLVMLGCSSESLTAVDSTPPLTVADLVATAASTTSVTLTWTAPGDDWADGTAAAYDLRYSSDPLGKDNWHLANPSTLPRPKSAGTQESFLLENLGVSTLYFFGLRTVDDAANFSDLSNIASARTDSRPPPPPPPLPEDPPTFVQEWGVKGSGQSEFDEPWGVAIGLDGNLYVTEAGNHRVQVFDATGSFLRMWGSFVCCDSFPTGSFITPRGIAVSTDKDLVYVVDTGNNRIQKFNLLGQFLSAWGALGQATGLFDQPMSIALDGPGNVYVTERGINDRVQVFDGDGRIITQWFMDDPMGIAIHNETVFALCYKTGRVQKFNLNGDTLGCLAVGKR